MSLVEVEIMRLGLDRASNSYVVILREKEGDRLLPIWIGQAEAESIVIEMHHMHRERPLTHDLCKHIITQLGATLRHVAVTHVSSRTYYAEIHLASRDGSVILDARPSDSIAIAIRFAAPIYVQESLLSEGLIDDAEVNTEGGTESGEEESVEGEEPAQPPYKPMTPEELKAYLENMHPEDFGKFHL